VPLFYAKRAAAYQSVKKLGQALRDLDAALEVDGNYSTGYLHRGKLHRWESSEGWGVLTRQLGCFISRVAVQISPAPWMVEQKQTCG